MNPFSRKERKRAPAQHDVPTSEYVRELMDQMRTKYPNLSLHEQSVLALKEVEGKERAATITPETSLLLRIDIQAAFIDGGLPLNGGEAVRQAAREQSQLDWGHQLDSQDYHLRKDGVQNISMAERHELPPFTNLYLNENDEVMAFHYSWQKPEEYQNISEYEVTQNYLKNVRQHRRLVSALLDVPLTGLEQTLWPNHAEEDEIDSLPGEKDNVIRKGHNRDDDSYSALADNSGNPVRHRNLTVAEYIDAVMHDEELDTLVLEGLATTHCDLFTAEGIALAEKLHSLVAQFPVASQRAEAIKTLVYDKIESLRLTDHERAKMHTVVRQIAEHAESLIKRGLTMSHIKNKYVIWDLTAPVEIGYDPAQVMRQYEQYGFQVVTNDSIQKNQENLR